MSAALVCEECGSPYTLSERRTRDVVAGRVRPICPGCRRADPGPPAAEHYRWWRETFSPEEFERLTAAMASLRP